MCETQAINSVSDIEKRIEFEISWENLPDLLLYMIFSRISAPSHRIMFSVVCKSWNLILRSPTPSLQQFQLNSKGCSYPYLHFTKNKLIHPFGGKVYELKKFPERALGVQLRTAREDWLLFTQNNYRNITPSKSFFFNPFTQKMVWLPDHLGNLCYSMSFTSPPTFENFKVVAVRNNPKIIGQPESITIDTFKGGEDRWTSCEFEIRNSLFEFSYCNPVLCKGKYYILDKRSRLLVHDPRKHTFFVHEAPESLRCDVREQYMLESQGKLLAVYVETSGSWVLVCRWNVSERKWEKLESLGNKVLFVSRPCSLSETATTVELGNRIYFPRLVGNNCLFYSLSTKKFHISDGSSFTTFHGSKSAFSSTWIKPNCVHVDV